MQGVIHKLFRGREDPFHLRLKSCFHVLTRLNICNASQVTCGSSAEYTLLFSAASTREMRTPWNPGVECGLISCAPVSHATSEEVLEWRSGYFMGRSASAQTLTMFSPGPTYDKIWSETELIAD